MPDTRVKKLLEDGDRLWSERLDLDSLWQTMALHFYPEMATFTTTRSLGEEFAQDLTSSFPLVARRTLGDAFSALLRPVNLDTTSPGVWFSIVNSRIQDKPDKAEGEWLEFATAVMRRAMYDVQANFARATKEGDHAFATFGQTPISIELNRARDTLLYRSHHLKDVVWTENAEGMIDHIQRRWKPTMTQLVQTFPGKVHNNVKSRASEAPGTRIDVRHIVISAENYEQRDRAGNRFRTPFVSIWIDVENQHVMEEEGSADSIYIIPRWVTIPGSQYASSPAVTAALPDARLIQAMTLTLLEAGEKHADPPLVATQEALRSDIQTFAGGVTYVDAEYDEKLGEALRPLFNPTAGQGLASGFEMRADVRDMISRAFFLDSLSLPPASSKEMTAFEVGERISEWIRRAMPIFEPLEFEYNGQLCEQTFNLLMRNGAFGPFEDIPPSLRGADVQFKFESPIHESNERRKGQRFLEATQALATAAEIDPSVLPILDASQTLRDVLEAIGAPAKWMRSEAETARLVAERQAQEQAQQQLVEAQTAATAGKDIGRGIADFAKAAAVEG